MSPGLGSCSARRMSRILPMSWCPAPVAFLPQRCRLPSHVVSSLAAGVAWRVLALLKIGRLSSARVPAAIVVDTYAVGIVRSEAVDLIVIFNALRQTRCLTDVENDMRSVAGPIRKTACHSIDSWDRIERSVNRIHFEHILPARSADERQRTHGQQARFELVECTGAPSLRWSVSPCASSAPLSASIGIFRYLFLSAVVLSQREPAYMATLGASPCICPAGLWTGPARMAGPSHRG